MGCCSEPRTKRASWRRLRHGSFERCSVTRGSAAISSNPLPKRQLPSWLGSLIYTGLSSSWTRAWQPDPWGHVGFRSGAHSHCRPKELVMSGRRGSTSAPEFDLKVRLRGGEPRLSDFRCGSTRASDDLLKQSVTLTSQRTATPGCRGVLTVSARNRRSTARPRPSGPSGTAEYRAVAAKGTSGPEGKPA